MQVQAQMHVCVANRQNGASQHASAMGIGKIKNDNKGFGSFLMVPRKDINFVVQVISKALLKIAKMEEGMVGKLPHGDFIQFCIMLARLFDIQKLKTRRGRRPKSAATFGGRPEAAFNLAQKC